MKKANQKKDGDLDRTPIKRKTTMSMNDKKLSSDIKEPGIQKQKTMKKTEETKDPVKPPSGGKLGKIDKDKPRRNTVIPGMGK